MKKIIAAGLLFVMFGGLYGQNSLRLHLNFDDNLEDLSGFNHNVQPLSDPAPDFTEGVCGGGALIKDNLSDGLSVDKAVFDHLQDFTVSFQAKLNGFGSINNLISCANSVTDNELIIGYSFMVDNFQDGWQFIIGGQIHSFDTDLTMNDLGWHHVVIMRRGDQGFLYIDQQLVGAPITVNDKTLSVAASGAIIGQDQDCVGGCFQPHQNWNGEIDDLKVFSEALTTEEIAQLDCSTPPVPVLRLYLNFDDNLEDLSGFNHNVQPLSDPAPDFTEGVCGGGVLIRDNMSDGLSVDKAVFDHLQDFTVSFQAKLNGFGSINNLISCANNVTDNELIIGYSFMVDNFQDGWQFIIGGQIHSFDTDLTMNDLGWHHVVIMRRGDQGFLYIDRQLAGAPITVNDKRLSVAASGAIIGQDQDCVGGCFQPHQNWNGEIDDLKVFSEALTTEEIAQLDCSRTLRATPVIYLQGAYEHLAGLMRDDLRTLPEMPLMEPYSGLGYSHIGGGGEQTQVSVFDVAGADAVVDWVFLELRDKNDFTNVVATRSALLQRDGDVVDIDGASPVAFADLQTDEYYLVVRHRNHLGAMTAAPVALSNATTAVDFTTDLNQIYGAANGIAILEDGRLGLFSGDFDGNGQVQNTDFAAMVQTLGSAGYEAGDCDLNGQVQNTDLQLKLVPNIGRGEAFD
jgi:hypothetical protein